MSLKSFYIYSRDSKNYRCQKNVWLLVTWYGVIGCHSNKIVFWKNVYHFYTNRKGVKNALKIIYTSYAKNQYFKSYKHFCILKKPGVNYTYNGKKICLNMSLRKFGLWNFFASFLAVCMADLSCICANVLPKYPNYWFKNFVFIHCLFQQFHVFFIINANFLTFFWPMRRCFIFI